MKLGRSVCIFIFSLALFFSCSNKNNKSLKPTSRSAKYATGFEIEESAQIKKITIYNPWEKATGISFTYYLIPRGTPVPDSLKNSKIIFTPVDRVICLSTSHIAYIDALGETEKIKGISGSMYVNNTKIIEGLRTGEIVDVGYDNNLNYEVVLQQQPDLVFVYGVGSEVTSYVNKMEDLGINVFYVAEYLEETPLGKAEWIKCIAPFFEKEVEAQSFFSEVEENYLNLKGKVKDISEKPEVLVGLPYRDSWWVPGGRSYLAHLIEDAGGNYTGKENESHESYVISFENALTFAQNANVWINTGSVNSKEEILASDERFANFPSYNNARIFNNNNRISPSGGNDFWESGAVYPDKILHDFIVIFHPGLLEKSDLFYYRKIE